MAPKSWADDSQTVFLTSHIPKFEVYQSTTRRYQPFWDFINPAFLERWPILPVGTKAEDLDETESLAYSDSLSKLYERIKQWYRWKCGPRSRNTSSAVTSKDIKEVYSESGTRQAKEYEVFVKLNPDVVTPVYKAECQRQGKEGRSKLPVWHKVGRDLWDKATQDQKTAVQAHLASLKDDEGPDLADPRTPSDYQKYWEKLPALLNKTVAPVVRKAGVLAFVTVVGPVPEAGGQILATTLQFGDKPETPLFSNTWADHDRVLVDQLASFASRYEFTTEICAQRSLLYVQKTETDSKAPDLGEGPSGEQVVPASPGSGDAVNAAGGGNSSEDSVILPTNQATEQPPAKIAPLPALQGQIASAIVPPPSTQLHFTIEGTSFTYDPTNFEIPDFQFDIPDEADWANPEVLETIMRSNAAPIPSLGTTFDTPPLEEAHRPGAANWNGSLPNSADPGLNAVAIAPPVLHAPIPEALANAPVVQHAPVLDVTAPISTISNTYAAAPNGAHAPISPSSINPPAPATSPVVVPPGTLVQDTPATVVAVMPPPTNVAVVEPPPAPQPASGLPLTAATSVLASTPLAVHASPANAPPVAPTSMPLPALPLHAPAATPPSFQCGHSNAGTQVAPHPSGTTMPTTWSATLSVNANAAPGLSPPFNLHVPNNNMPAFDPGLLETSNHQQQDRAPFQDVDNVIRRSGRAPVPSTRLEKLNEIGDNIPPSRPPPTHGEPEEPAWFAPAYKHLKNSSLGLEWDTLVEKWAGYERMKGWKSGKGLPAKGRLVEWSQWTSKARQGVRNYQNTPKVKDPVELGIFIGKWAATFTEADFGRTGPNGIVSLLTMMVWWGIPALIPSSWNGDSRPQWRTLLQNLLQQFDRLLTNKISTTKRSREGDGSDENQENKRPPTDGATV